MVTKCIQILITLFVTLSIPLLSLSICKDDLYSKIKLLNKAVALKWNLENKSHLLKFLSMQWGKLEEIIYEALFIQFINKESQTLSPFFPVSSLWFFDKS